MYKYAGQLKTHNYEYTEKRNHHKNASKKSRKICDDIFVFDIETTSAWRTHDGKIIPYEKGKSAEYWNDLQPLSLCYVWQFSVNNIVYYGRELEDFLQLLSDLPADMEIIIWVHNLSFEFAFLSSYLSWDKIFARAPHKPMYAISTEYPHITFRCSYILTRLSLESWGKQIGTKKLVGNLDYEVIRTPLTHLTDDELDYAEMDCIVVYEGIKQYVKRYGNQQDIPLTQTGTVRKVVKELLMENESYVRYVHRLIPKNADQYARLQRVFAGGYTHANRFYAGQVIRSSRYGKIRHYDFASSYPTQMIAMRYPCTPWIYIGKTMPKESTFDDKAYMIELRFYDIECTSFNTYIQASKVTGSGFVYDNGRIIKADTLTILITEVDYITIKNNYRWRSMEVLNCWESHKEYLPTEFCNYILELYENKTKLKGVEGYEDLYMQSKAYINSLFGMAVTGIIQADVVLDGDEWSMIPLTKEMVEEKLHKLRFSYKNDKRYFLSYSWGCWVTAYARRALWQCIESCDEDVLYCDTDSIFVIGDHSFRWYDDMITDKLLKACKENNLDANKLAPLDPKGKAHPLGIFTEEPPCLEFITLGAKRYCERREEDNALHLTISGINKGAVELLDDNIENFRDGFVFDKDADCVTKKLCSYITDQPPLVWPDGYKSSCTHGINLRRTGYDMTVTDEYKRLIQYENYNVDDVTDQVYNAMRKIF